MEKPKAEYPNRICSFRWYPQKEMDAFLEEQAAKLDCNSNPFLPFLKRQNIVAQVAAALRGKAKEKEAGD